MKSKNSELKSLNTKGKVNNVKAVQKATRKVLQLKYFDVKGRENRILLTDLDNQQLNL